MLLIMTVYYTLYIVYIMLHLIARYVYLCYFSQSEQVADSLRFIKLQRATSSRI